MEFISKIQREIVLSPSNLKLINGCAGSRKTDTLIKCGLEKIARGNLLFLTLVSSVTDEIRKRLEKMLGIKIERQYGSNVSLIWTSASPYFGVKNGISL